MPELSFAVDDWLAPTFGPKENQVTTGSLRIEAQTDEAKVVATEVEDRLAQTVRPRIHVPLVELAEWLVINWWRLRWEARPNTQQISTSWRMAHRLSAIGGGTPWPPLEIASDGEYVSLVMEAETSADAATIRYLQPFNVDLPASAFEKAVDELLETVVGRLASTYPAYRELAELKDELDEERVDDRVSSECRWQALAGLDPSGANDAWLAGVRTLLKETGERAGEEVLGLLQGGCDLTSARDQLEAMKSSSTAIDLSWVQVDEDEDVQRTGERPWELGARLAARCRQTQSIGQGPISNKELGDLLGTSVPLRGNVSRSALHGGYRGGRTDSRTGITISSHRPETQRFALARLIGSAYVLPKTDSLLPVADSYSAHQKMQRSFAQELLCPWQELDAFTEAEGMGDEALERAAEHFQVSDWLVRTTLVNRGKMDRRRLPSALR